MIYLGKVMPGSTILLPFESFAGNGSSVTLTGLAVTDIEIYKDSSMTQRASDNGYTLLDTDGIDIDGATGIHGLTISLADNSDAGFYAAGSKYYVVIDAVTISTQTVRFILAMFEIGLPNAVLNTTIATLSSQVSFTLTSGPAENDALNGCVAYIHDVASAVQGGFAVVEDYVGSTKTVTLTAGVTFTAAAPDNIAFFPPSNVEWASSVRWTNGALVAGTIAANAFTAAKFATNAIDNNALAANAVTEIQVGLATSASIAALNNLSAAQVNTEADTAIADAGLATAANLATVAGYLDTEIAAILAKANLIPGTIDGKTFIEGWTLAMAVLLGKASGLATATAIYRSVDDVKDRVTATVDADGNRTAVLLDAA